VRLCGVNETNGTGQRLASKFRRSQLADGLCYLSSGFNAKSLGL